MKTIATAAVLMMLVAPAWADEAESKQADDPANTNEPIVLSEAEMDGVTAGLVEVSVFNRYVFSGDVYPSAQVKTNGFYSQSYTFYNSEPF